MTDLHVFMCVRNNQKSLVKTLNSLECTENAMPHIRFAYYIYENDSTDNTCEFILDFMKKRRGNVSVGNKLNKIQWTSVKDKNRIRDMAMYRNRMKGLCADFATSKYSIILDSEISFSPTTIQEMIKVLDTNPDIAMTTPWGVSNAASYKRRNAYYDLYALLTLKDNWTVENQNGMYSEHVYFCERVRKYGSVVICRDIAVQWGLENCHDS